MTTRASTSAAVRYLGRPLEITRPSSSDRRRDREGDPAAGARVDWPVDGQLGFVEHGDRFIRIGGGRDRGAVDAIEKMEADARFARDLQRLPQQPMGFGGPSCIHRGLRSSLQGVRLTRWGRQRSVELAGRGQVVDRFVEAAGEQSAPRREV